MRRGLPGGDKRPPEVVYHAVIFRVYRDEQVFLSGFFENTVEAAVLTSCNTRF
jgi:hypothetical protein